MSGRIWPGALCVVRGSRTPEINDQFVIAESRCPDCGDFMLDGNLVVDEESGESWVVRSAVSGALLPWEDLDSGGVDYAPRRVLMARLLRPILPPPGADSTEDRAPCEVDAPMFAG